MKRHPIALLAALILGLLLVQACKSTRDERCSYYVAAYETYQATLASGRTPSKEEIAGAQIAAAFLTVNCGWQRTRAADPNGVPVVKPAASK